MKRLLHVAAFAATVICQTTASAQDANTCGQGTVRQTHTLFETVTPETVTTRSVADDAARLETDDGRSRRMFVVTVELGNQLYVSQSTDARGALDPLPLQPGDSIDVCVNRTQMILERSDGTGFHAPRGSRTLQAGTRTPSPVRRTQ